MRLFLKILLVMILAGGAFGYWKAQQFKQQFAGRQPILDEMAAAPADFGLPSQRFEGWTKDGVSIVGWLIEASDARATILVVHGFGLNKSHMLGRAEVMHGLGYNVALIDLRARGESGGDQAEVGPKAALDVHAAVAALQDLQQIARSPLVAYGFSHGARTVIFAAAESGAFDAVIAESPPYSIREGMKRTMNLPWAPPMPEGDLGQAIEDMGEVPFLLWGGDQDEGLTLLRMEELVARARHPLSHAFVFDGAGHGVFGEHWLVAYEAQLQQAMAVVVGP